MTDRSPDAAPPVSILILTLNEQQNIGACLDSLAGFEDIVVFDSYSTDETCRIAEARGARVVQRKFDDWASHQNWALANIAFAHSWVFYLDADERMTPELQDELSRIAHDPDLPAVAYYVGRKNMLFGQWLKHSMPPSPVMRFFRPPYVTFERLVNPTANVDGEYGFLKSLLLHYNFSKGMEEWFAKHNWYSTLEAREFHRTRDRRISARQLLSGSRVDRRKALKDLSSRMPCRGALKFTYLYFLRGGFRDGRIGFLYCRLQAIYESMIEIKLREIRREQNAASNPP